MRLPEGDADPRLRPPGRRCPTLLANDKLVLYSAMLWMTLLLYFESISFYSDVASCVDAGAKWRDPSKTEATEADRVTRVVVISDPNLVPDPIEGTESLGQGLKRFVNDLWLKKVYQVLQSVVRPELVVFAGRPTNISHSSVPLVENVPSFQERWNWVFSKYSPEIGPNWITNISLPSTAGGFLGRGYEMAYFGPFEFVFLDISRLNPNEAKTSGVYEFMAKKLGRPIVDRLLILNGPLETNEANCSTSGAPLDLSRRFEYEDYLPAHEVAPLLARVLPTVVVSTHSPVVCEREHRIPFLPKGIHEYSVSPFNWLTTRERPSFLYLKLVTTSKAPKVEAKFCSTKNQWALYNNYLIGALITWAVVLVFAVDYTTLAATSEKGSAKLILKAWRRLKVCAKVFLCIGMFVFPWFSALSLVFML